MATTISATDPYWLTEANNGPGSIYDSTSTFTGAGTDPRYLPGGQYYTAVSQYQPDTGGQVLGATTGGGGLDTGQQALVNKQFDYKIGQLNDSIAQLPQQQSLATLGVQNAYQGNMNQLNTSHDRGIQDLGTAQQQVNYQKAQSLQQLADQLRQQGMSYNNQLGAVGAGDSSAVGLINQALSSQASKNRGGVLQQAANQNNAIDTQRGRLEQDFTTNIGKLDQWKQSNLFDIAQKFQAQKQQLDEAIATAQGQRAQQLAQYQPVLLQQAIDAITNLQNTYNTHASSLVDQYKAAASPGFNIDPSLGQFQVQANPAGQIAQIPGAPVQNVQFDPLAQLLKRKEDQQNSIIGA